MTNVIQQKRTTPSASATTSSAYFQLAGQETNRLTKADNKSIGSEQKTMQRTSSDDWARSDQVSLGSLGKEIFLDTAQGDSLDDCQQSDGEAKKTLDRDQANRHSVGPVMGIFFKVWSLVKVTRGRHQQKMRRQNSEDTSQFQYIPGDQLEQAATCSGDNQHQLRSTWRGEHHFRRAGSQPAPSLTSRPPLEPLICSNLTAAAPPVQHQRRPQPANTSPQVAGGTSSTSSGVSSLTTSSSLASAQANRQMSATPTPTPGSSNPNFGRQASANSLQAATAGAGAGFGQREQRADQEAPANDDRQPVSWTSRIKRSVTTVNQSELSSYVSSRYSRFRRDHNHPNHHHHPNPNRHHPNRAASESENVFSRSKFRKHQQEHPFNQQQHQPPVNEQRQQFGKMRERKLSVNSAPISDEDDSNNDIYSTPNDSIQSVPLISAAPSLSCQSKAASSNNAAQQQTTSSRPANPIIKSFSTTNFSQLIKQQTSFKPIVESANNEQESAPQKGPKECKLESGDSFEISARQRSSNGSRFFISSSSSEESNPPNQPQRQTELAANSSGAQLSSHEPSIRDPDYGAQSEGHRKLVEPQAELRLQHGVHYHALSPILRRPDSLALDGAQNLHLLPVAVFTPTSQQQQQQPATVILSGLQQVAAMSPSNGDFARATSYSSSRFVRCGANYRKSPSLFEMSSAMAGANQQPRLSVTRFSSRFPRTYQGANSENNNALPISSFKPPESCDKSSAPTGRRRIPSSVSLFDCKLATANQQQQQQQAINESANIEEFQQQVSRRMSARNFSALNFLQQTEKRALMQQQQQEESEYKLAQMLLQFGSNPKANSSAGYSALIHAILSDNLAAIKCLIENGVDLNETNQDGFSAIDLICGREPTQIRLEILKLLIDNRADLDRAHQADGSRLLDRLIGEHRGRMADKLPYIDLLLQNGAKLGSSTWLAANGKQEIQLRLLRKLCQDGYYLYKSSSIEAAVYRFEYALKRIAELEQQLASIGDLLINANHLTHLASQQIKYQTYLGLSRCERKRRFYKRALEFAHLAILIDSTAYEGFYSKSHILKDLGELDDSLITIDQTSRLVDKSIESLKIELKNQEEALIFDGCFNVIDPKRTYWIEAARTELSGNLDYLLEAKKYISRLRCEIMDDKLRSTINYSSTTENESQTTNGVSSSTYSNAAKANSSQNNPIAI